MDFTYCRLEIHKWSFFEKISLNLKQEDSLLNESNIIIYSEKINDYKILKKRISQLTEIWVANLENPLEREYPSFMIFNRKRQFGRISLTEKGWLPPTTHFYGYLLRHLVNLHGKEHYRNYLNELKGEEISFVSPEWNQQFINDIELVSSETLDILLANFFEIKSSQDFFRQAFEQELIKKGIVA